MAIQNLFLIYAAFAANESRAPITRLPFWDDSRIVMRMMNSNIPFLFWKKLIIHLQLLHFFLILRLQSLYSLQKQGPDLRDFLGEIPEKLFHHGILIN